MNDGTTAIPVGPITEDDMNKLQSIFQRALDAIVSMSKLASEVETLRQQVSQLTDDAERLRRANAGLDESLYQARNQRLELERKLADASTTARTASDNAERAEVELTNARARIDNLRADLDKSENDHLAALGEIDDLKAKLKAAEAKVSAIHSALGIEPKKDEVPPPSSGQVVLTPPTAPDTSPSSSAPEPAPLEAWMDPRPATTRTYFDTWQQGAMWDDERRQYYTEH